MAKYFINQSGIEALQEMRDALYQSVNDIFESINKLQSEIHSLEDDLGIFYQQIRDENKRALTTLRNALDGDDGIGYLINVMLPKMINDMERLIEADLGEGDDDDPQKVLTLGR